MKFTIYNLQFTINKEKFLVFFISLLAFMLRVYRLSEYPAGLNADEAAIGYNAYSLLQTGKDEFGHSWPINFQSFNDFKPGFYFYLVLPFIKIFGLNEWAVRLPSAIMGGVTVILLYFLVKKLWGNIFCALGASILLCITPWHLHFSRGGWESNAATFLMTLGVYFFVVFLEKGHWFLLLSALSFCLSMFSYHSARVVVPLLVLGLILFNWKKIFSKSNLRWILITIGIGGALMTLLLFSMRGDAGGARFSGVGILADKGPFWRVNELRGQHRNPFGIWPKIVHNQYFEYAIQFFDNYLRHFNGDFLFISGDEIQRNRVPETGQLLLVSLPFLILGFVLFLKEKPKGWKEILWWLAVSPVASALTFQSPHAIRALNMVVPLIVLTGYGVTQSFFWLKKKTKLYYVLCILYLGLIVWNFGFYLHQYYVHYPQTYPAAWEYGFRELVGYLAGVQKNYDKIYVTNKYDQPYILFAFYLKYPPEQFQREARLTSRDQYGFSTVERFGKYIFNSIDINKLPKGGKNLVIGTPQEIPDSATIVKRIYYKDGKTEAFRIIEN